MQPRPEAATSLHVLHRSPSSRNLVTHFDYPRISIRVYWWEAIVESVTGHQRGAPRMLILLKCLLVEGELCGGSMGEGGRGFVYPLAEYRVGVPDSRRMILAVYSDAPLVIRSKSGGWAGGWLDPPCGSLKWPTSIEMEVYRDRLVDEAGESRWLVQIAV